MASTFAMAFFGFFFWIINARLYKPESVGITTSLISVISLLSTVSLFGFNNGIVSYLPKEKDKNHMINTMFTFTGVAGVVISIVFLLGLSFFAPKLLFIRANPLFIAGFIVLVVLSVWNIMTDSAFLAFRSTQYTFLANLISSFAKLVAPFFFISLGGAGIFAAYVTYLTLSTGISFLLMFIRLGYKPKMDVDKKIIRQTAKFSFMNYLAGTIGMLPTLIIPIWILNRLGAKEAAYYYMASMIMALLGIIPSGITRSLFAEGSHNQKHMKALIKKAVIGVVVLVIPAIIITIIFGGTVLTLFGESYSEEGFRLLQLMAASLLFTSTNHILGSIFNIRKETGTILGMTVFGAITILLLINSLINLKLNGVGFAWLISQMITAFVFLIIFFLKKHD
jgi:O-antigen/teichoic acid export membrane protein